MLAVSGLPRSVFLLLGLMAVLVTPRGLLHHCGAMTHLPERYSTETRRAPYARR